MNAQDMITNYTFAEIELGAGAQLTRTVLAEDVQLFAAMSGDANPEHIDPDYAKDTVFHGVVAQGMWGGALIASVIGTEYPGPGSVYLEQTLRFLQPVHVGDTLVVSVRVIGKEADTHHVTLACECTNASGTVVIDGVARVLATVVKIHRPRMPTKHVILSDKVLPAPAAPIAGIL